MTDRSVSRAGPTWLSVTLVALFVCAHSARAGMPPAFAEVKASFIASEAVLLDRQGLPVSEIRVDQRARRLDWVALEDISPALTATLIAAEDRRFYDHHGVDWTGIASAAWDSVWRSVDGKRPRGGSTITMQLAA